MPSDYDLVILGGSLEGRSAAMAAVGYGARVALVEPPGLFDDGQRQRFLLKGLQQLAQVRQRQAVGEWFGYGPPSGELDWSALVEWSRIAAESQSVRLSGAALSASGVDVVLERPERLSRGMVVMTENRRLSARGVLAAYGVVPAVMPLVAANSTPDAVDVGGGCAIALAWAEALAAVGVRVRLIAERLLPGADGDVRRLVRSQLIAAGIKIAAEADQNNLTLKIEPAQPTLTLPDFVYDRSAKHSYLKVNNKLQTAHSRLFACGSALGGSLNARLAEYEAKIAVRNALFLPTEQVDYSSVVQGYGRYAGAGLTQAEAERRYGDAVRVWTASDARSADLSRVEPLPEFCKLVFERDRLVGIHLLGEGTEGLACLLSQRLGQRVSGLANGRLSGQALVDLVLRGTAQYQSSQWQIDHWRRDWAENWFNWRRSRHS